MTTDKKCGRCGGSNLEPGDIRSTGNIYFRPTNTKFFTLTTNDVLLRANICIDCGGVDLVGDTEKVRRLAGEKAQPH